MGCRARPSASSWPPWNGKSGCRCPSERAGASGSPAGRLLVDHTDALLAQLDAAEADLAALRDQVAGRVRLAAFPSAAAAIVPPAWAALARSAPHVQLDLLESEPEESLPAAARGEIDLAIAHEYDLLPRPLDPLCERRELLSDPVLVAVPASSSAAPEGPVELRSLTSQPFLAPRSNTSCAEMIQRACARAGFVPRVVARASDFHVLLSLVAAGAGVTLVPQLAARRLPPGVALVPPASRSPGRSSPSAAAAVTASPRSASSSTRSPQNLLADASQDESDVVLAALAQRLTDRLRGALQRRAGLAQDGAERVAQRGDAVVERPGAAFRQSVGVQRERRLRQRVDPGWPRRSRR